MYNHSQVFLYLTSPAHIRPIGSPAAHAKSLGFVAFNGHIKHVPIISKPQAGAAPKSGTPKTAAAGTKPVQKVSKPVKKDHQAPQNPPSTIAKGEGAMTPAFYRKSSAKKRGQLFAILPRFPPGGVEPP